jgi:hypothetical protein
VIGLHPSDAGPDVRTIPVPLMAFEMAN